MPHSQRQNWGKQHKILPELDLIKLQKKAIKISLITALKTLSIKSTLTMVLKITPVKIGCLNLANIVLAKPKLPPPWLKLKTSLMTSLFM